jgi:hypothetical protein
MIFNPAQKKLQSAQPQIVTTTLQTLLHRPALPETKAPIRLEGAILLLSHR